MGHHARFARDDPEKVMIACDYVEDYHPHALPGEEHRVGYLRWAPKGINELMVTRVPSVPIRWSSTMNNRFGGRLQVINKLCFPLYYLYGVAEFYGVPDASVEAHVAPISCPLPVDRPPHGLDINLDAIPRQYVPNHGFVFWEDPIGSADGSRVYIGVNVLHRLRAVGFKTTHDLVYNCVRVGTFNEAARVDCAEYSSYSLNHAGYRSGAAAVVPRAWGELPEWVRLNFIHNDVSRRHLGVHDAVDELARGDAGGEGEPG